MRKNPTMSNQTNLTDARNNLADICAQVVADREVRLLPNLTVKTSPLLLLTN
jgi:antitoxin YefM